jgi:hypothetical protein
MADGDGGGSNTFLGLIVGALLVAVVAIGGFLFLNHKGAAPAPTLTVSVPTTPPTQPR